MTKRLNLSPQQLVDEILTWYGSDAIELTTAGIKAFSEEFEYSRYAVANRLAEFKASRGKYTLERIQKLEAAFDATPTPSSVNLVPETDDNFVPFGNFKDVKQIIKSKVFVPIFITGLSGNGKTHSVEQACAQLGRELVRCNITIETDEDDLLGGFRLQDGNTVWHDGPIVEALQRGAVLLLDEVDLASNKILCLQSLLEGKGVYLKKVNRYVKPSPGFNVIATANTKGKGDDTGMFIGANILNEAFLERFAFTFEQDYPTPSVEAKILTRYFCELLGSGGTSDFVSETITNLTTWAEIIRKTYDDGGVDSVITTRRLINIVKAYAVWEDLNKAIDVCINRFDDDTKSVFKQLFDKLTIPAPEVTLENISQDDEVQL